MKVEFYKYETQSDGFHIQTETCEKTVQMNKKELLAIADLRHPVLSESEFYDMKSKDQNGGRKQTFGLCSSLHYLIIHK